MSLISAPIMPPRSLQTLARAPIDQLTTVGGRAPINFTNPVGAAALLPPPSISWRVFKNPVALYVGGVAAVILELAEPRVRITLAGKFADRLVLEASPAVQACRQLGLPADYLYRHNN